MSLPQENSSTAKESFFYSNVQYENISRLSMRDAIAMPDNCWCKVQLRTVFKCREFFCIHKLNTLPDFMYAVQYHFGDVAPFALTSRHLARILLNVSTTCINHDVTARKTNAVRLHPIFL
jgi:hypothetical protein